MNTVFNVVMLKHGENSLSYIKEPLDDFINHLNCRVEKLHIIDYANCVEVRADYQDKSTMSLIFDSTMFNKSTIVATPNTIVLCLMNRRNFTLGWKYEDKSQEVLNYKDALTRENTDEVVKLRKNLWLNFEWQNSKYPYLVDAPDGENKYPYVLDGTKKSIKNGEYKKMSEYEVECAFMDAIRGAYEVPTMRPLINEGEEMYVFELTKEEQAILNAKPKMYVPLCDRKANIIQSYFSCDGKFKPQYMKDFYAKPKIVTTTENKNNKSKRNKKSNPQKSLDEFMR